MMRLTRVDKEPEYEMDGCVVCRENDFSVDKFDDRTVTICDQCEKEYHVVCLRNIGLRELESIPHFNTERAEYPYKFFNWNVTHGDICPLGVRQRGILING